MKNTLLGICLLCWVSGFGQNKFTISGNVLNDQNDKVFTGQAFLLDQEGRLIDFSIIEDGNFILNSVSGDFQLKIEVLNYKPYAKTIHLKENLPLTIQLKPALTALGEVQLVGKRRTVSTHNGNFNINIENSVFETLPQTKDLLAKLPKIQISPDGEQVTVVGKGPALIYLDKQRIQFWELNSIPVASIKNIEIINNPGAKYEAEGRSVIVVHLKENPEEGIKASITEIVSFKRRFNNYASSTLNFRRNKLSMAINFAYNRLHHWESHQFEFSIIPEDIFSRYHVVTAAPKPQIVSGLGLTYIIDEDTELSGNLNFRNHKENFPIETETFLEKGEEITDISTLTQNKTTTNYLSSQINYNKSFGKKQNLFFGGQYSEYRQDLQTEIFNSINQQAYEFSEARDQDFDIRRSSMRIDYENKLNVLANLAFGASLGLARANAYTLIDDYSDDYIYREAIYASYADLSGNHNKLEYRLGLRVEKSFAEGNYADHTDLLIDRDNTNWLPTVLLSYTMKNENQLSLHYKSSIQRPNYSKASSFTTYINPFMEFSGNIKLKPTYTDEVELSYRWNKYNLGLTYFAQKNPVYYTADYNEGLNRLTISPNNLERENGLQLELSAPFTYKFLTSSNSIMLAYGETKDAAGVQKFKAKPFLYYYSNNEFDINPKIKLGINFWGLTKRYKGLYKRDSMFVIGASLSRTFFEKLQVSLNLNDIFRQMNYRENYQINNIYTESLFFADGQEFAVGLTYAFGKEFKTDPQPKEVDEELDRIK